MKNLGQSRTDTHFTLARRYSSKTNVSFLNYYMKLPHCHVVVTTTAVPAGNYMFKVNNRNTRTRCEICSELTIKAPEDVKLISNLVLVFLLSTLSR